MGLWKDRREGENRAVMSVEDESGTDASLDLSKLSLRRTCPRSSNHLSLVHKWVLHLLIHGSSPASIIHYGRCVQEREGVVEKQ